MPYEASPTNSNLKTYVNGPNHNPGENNGNAGGSGDKPTQLTDYGVDDNFYNRAFTWEPKYQHKFVMNIDGIPAYLVKTSANRA